MSSSSDVDITQEFHYINRKGGTVMLSNGYQYYKHKVYKNGNSIWRCSYFKKARCLGNVTIENDQKLINAKDHTCTRDFTRNEIDLKLRNLKNKVIRSDKPVPQLYNEMLTKMKDKGLHFASTSDLPSLHNIHRGLYLARNRSLCVKNTVFKNLEKVEVPVQFSDFLLADYNHEHDDDDDERILVFCTHEMRNMIGEIKEIFIDGTFKSCPRPFTQLYVILGEFKSTSDTTHVVPLIYALMSRKTQNSYVKLMSMIKSQLPQFSPITVHCDLEIAAINAVLKVFPSVSIKCCYYHWSKNIWKHAKSCNHTKTKVEKRIVALCAALPLLPKEKILEGFDYIQTEAKRLNMGKFLEYVKKFWLKKTLIKFISVFGLRHRTNNVLEGWNAKLNRSINKNRVTLLHLLNVLKKINVIAETKKDKTQPKRRALDVFNDDVIREVQMELITDVISVGYALEKLR